MPWVETVVVLGIRTVNPQYRDWIREKPCMVSHPDHLHVGMTQACHVKSRGAGGKDEGNMVPLCASAHTGPKGQHTIGIKTFQKMYDIDMKAKAAALWAEYTEWETY